MMGWACARRSSLVAMERAYWRRVGTRIVFEQGAVRPFVFSINARTHTLATMLYTRLYKGTSPDAPSTHDTLHRNAAHGGHNLSPAKHQPLRTRQQRLSAAAAIAQHNTRDEHQADEQNHSHKRQHASVF